MSQHTLPRTKPPQPVLMPFKGGLAARLHETPLPSHPGKNAFDTVRCMVYKFKHI